MVQSTFYTTLLAHPTVATGRLDGWSIRPHIFWYSNAPTHNKRQLEFYQCFSPVVAWLNSILFKFWTVALTTTTQSWWKNWFSIRELDFSQIYDLFAYSSHWEFNHLVLSSVTFHLKEKKRFNRRSMNLNIESEIFSSDMCSCLQSTVRCTEPLLGNPTTS